MRKALGVVVAGVALAALLGLGAHFALQAAPDEPGLAREVDTTVEITQPTPAAAGSRPNILLYTIDTLRADHLGSYGYGRDTSPAIDALAARGTRFTRAYSTSSWTLPAVASLLSGVLPSEHATTHSVLVSNGTAHQDFLSGDLPSLAQTLHDAGYRTVGVTANTHLIAEVGFARGFDEYVCDSFHSTDRERPSIWSRLDALRDDDRPWFLWIHVTDPHVTYTPRAPQFEGWWDPSRPRYPDLEHHLFLTGIGRPARAQGIPVEEALAYVTAAYDSEIRATDTLLEDLLAELDDGNLAVVVTADHGEELNDHGLMGHGLTLFDEVARVPLVIALPAAPPVVVTTPVSILDVLPTLAEIGDGSVTGAAGVSLVGAMHGDSLASRDIVMESGRRVPVRAIVDERYKFAERLGPRPIEVLFDLEVDPGEHHSCIADHADVAAAMRERLHAALADAASRHREATVTQIAVPDEIRERLRAIGYEQPE